MKRSLMVFGGNGLLGTSICKFAVSQGVEVISVSRSGFPKKREQWMKNVQYLKGDAMDHSTYESLIPSVNGIIHSIGVFFDSRTPWNPNVYEGSYEHLNRDTALRICELIQNKDKTFVYISAERAPFFMPNYLNTKRQVEDYLGNFRDKIPNAVLRPGIMYNEDDPVRKSIACAADAANKGDSILKSLGLEWVSHTFLPAKSLKYDQVGKVAVLAALNPEFRGKTLDTADIERADQQWQNLDNVI